MPRVLRLANLSDGFPLVVDRIRHHGATSLHTHDFSELVIILAGRGVHYSTDTAYPVIAGDAFVVTQAHGYRETEDLDLINVLFDAQRLALPLEDARKLPGYHAFFALEPRFRRRHGFRSSLHLSLAELAVVSELVAQMEAELRKKSSGYELMTKSLMLQLIGRLSRAYERMRAVESRPLIRLGTVLSHLERHYAEEVRLEDLAEIAGTSTSSLQRAFRAITGHAPIEYLIRLRLLRACELLRKGELNVTETAYRVGFTDGNYFSRQFRRVMACSPREFVNRARLAG
ncbi:MAG TPA: helix-turn-helix domain-containing protein [Spirochaetia bacterium]|nr:helix-turn-helix domain-containing protein [Spirochaetia bacterium]